MRPYDHLRAFVIGVSRYADAQHDLSYARSDAEAVAHVLQGELGFDEVATLYDGDATRVGVLRFFEHDLQKCDEDDGIFIFFAGHGVTVPSGIGDDRGFLVPHDGDLKRPFANISLTAIRDDYLPMVPAKHVFLAVDACYGGLALRDIQSAQRSSVSLDESVVAELTRKDRKVRQVLAAGAKDQRVLDGGLFGHSVFTGRLLETLLEANPFMTGDYLGVRVKEKVARDAVERNHRQTPQFGYLVGGEGTFVFSKKSKSIAQAGPRTGDVPRQESQTPTVSSWEELTSSCWLNDNEIRSALDAWSAYRKKRLHPITQVAKLTSVKNLCTLQVVATAMIESRELIFESMPMANRDEMPTSEFAPDIWSLPFRVPDGLVKAEYAWRGSKPVRVRPCPKCKGLGKAVCEKCGGKRTVSCSYCDGKGKLNGTNGWRKCGLCDGGGVLACADCRGIDDLPCSNCGVSGRVVDYPAVKAVFSVVREGVFLADKTAGDCYSEDASVAVWERTIEGRQVPPMPDFLPARLKNEAETFFLSFLNKASGRVCRVGLSLFLVPVHECFLSHEGRPFKICVSPLRRRVVSVENDPKTFLEGFFG